MPTVSVVEIDEDFNVKPDSEKVFEVEDNSIIFDALEDQGHELPHGCLAGSCGSCRCFVIEGLENLSTPSLIEENTTTDIYNNLNNKVQSQTETSCVRLTCRARITKEKVKIAIIK